MILSSRPEYLNVPEYNKIDTYTRDKGTLAVRLASVPELGILPYHQDQGVIFRAVELDNEVVGELSLKYDYGDKMVRIDHIYLGEEYRGKGIGSALYRAALKLPLPDGREPREHGFVLESNGGSDKANKVWESFVERGLADRQAATDRHYVMH